MRQESIKRLLSIITALVVCISELTCYIPVKAKDTEIKYALEHRVISSWDGGYQGEIELSNLSNEKMTDWNITIITPNQITDMWGGFLSISDSEDDGEDEYHYSVNPENYNSQICSGDNVCIGYISNGAADMMDISAECYFGASEIITPAEDDIEGGQTSEELTGGIYIGDGYRVEVQIPQVWDHAYNLKMLITNTSEEVIHNWGFMLESTDSISGLYNALEISEHDGVRIFKNAGYNQDIPIGSTIEVGYTAFYEESSDIPDEFSLVSINKSLDNKDFSVEIFIIDEWNEGSIADIIVKNTSENAIEDWEMEFDTDMDICGIWGGEIISRKGIHYTVKNPDYAQNIDVDDFWTVEMQIRGTTKAIKNIRMRKVVVGGENIESVEDYKDSDGDGIPDEFEEELGTDLLKTDTDDDGLSDYEEIFIVGTDPNKYDSVETGMSDYDSDSDGDGISNGEELKLGLNPINEDTDYDTLSDGDEINVYHTDPLKEDTDDDTLLDSDEIIIGLDPLNPMTTGILDTECIILQEIDSNSEVLESVNGKEKAYQLSLQVRAAGNARKMEIKESAYSSVLKNESVIGVIPDFSYGNKMEEMVISFKVNEAYINNSLGTYAVNNEEFVGIKRLSIAYYSEDLQVCLPIETQYDEDTHVVYTSVSNQGTYCLIDMEKWLDMFGLAPESFKVGGNPGIEYDGIHQQYTNGTGLAEESYRGHFYALIPSAMHWDAAKEYCESVGGHLVTIGDADEQRFIEDKLLGHSSFSKYWIGGYTKNALDEFEWITGESFTYTNWRHGEPNWLYEKYMHIYDSTNPDYFGLWNNEEPDSGYYFICEWENEKNVKPLLFFAVTMNPVPEDFGTITVNNTADYDGDGVSNNKEIHFSFSDPSLKTTISLFELYSYYEVVTGLASGTNRYLTEKAIMKFQNIYIVMINSDPTVQDSDGDGINDRTDTRPLSYDSYPGKFLALINLGIMNMSELYQTSDGFTLSMTSLYEVYKGLGYPDNSLYSYESNNSSFPDDADCFYLRDWYFFAIEDEEAVSYGMVLLEPYRSVNNGPCRVAVPFVEVNSIAFSLYSSSLTNDVKKALYEVTNCNENSTYSDRIVNYFMKANAQGNYVLSEQYVRVVLNEELEGNTITAVLMNTNPSDYRDAVLDKYCIDKHKDGVYNPHDNTIIITDYNNPSIAEIQCVLSCRTNNPSMNSFAGEICFHARALYAANINYETSTNPFEDLFWPYAMYKHAIRADLNLDKEAVGIAASPYKDYDGMYVKEQRAIFGDR
ncbi:MAG: cellulose binding domain-containing protein [Lachnospiraceae bacterium]|nr:cellulose binding domain-containing protein [Lachnospiraceae bacterium]